MDETELSKHEWNLKEQDFLITIYHRKFAKRPQHTTVVQNVLIYICWGKIP